jgi:hypothetical protein
MKASMRLVLIERVEKSSAIGYSTGMDIRIRNPVMPDAGEARHA